MPELKANKKTRTEPPEVRRRQLINATIDCIGKNGISGTTLTGVTRQAGLSLGLANFHFKSKEVLFSETLKHLAQEHRELWAKQANRADLSASEKLKALVDAQFHPRVCSRKKLAVWFAFFGDVKLRKTYREVSSDIDMERQEVTAALCVDLLADTPDRLLHAESIAKMLEALFDGFWLNILTYPEVFSSECAKNQVLSYLARVLPGQFR